MKTSDKAKYKIDKFEKGYVFTYADFDIEVNEADALKKYLNRLVESSKIARLSKGRFYKPKQGIVNSLNPNEYEVVKDLLKDGKKTIGYITGYTIFNSFKLTTQIPNVIQIGVNFDKKGLKRNIYTIRFVRQWNKITKTNIPLLQLLDCIRFIKTIPDTTITNSLNRITILIEECSLPDKKKLIDLAINYPPSTRALTGAIIENAGYTDLSDKLLKTLKSTSWYTFNISENILPNKKEMENKMTLHSSKELFEKAIKETADNLRIKDYFIEKDYWISLVLKRLSESKYVNSVVFKGGTSLSKGHKQFNNVLAHDQEQFDEPLGWNAKKIQESPLINDFSSIWAKLKTTYTNELSMLAYTDIPTEKEVAESFKKLIVKLISVSV